MKNKSEEEVILVDAEDRKVGTMDKMEAHEKGVLHRAFSIFIFNSNGHWLLQQRAPHKYHSPGLWSNTCCSHPRDGESVIDAGTRRLKEEMGMYCQLEPQFQFIYRCQLPNGLIEHELDHVLLGYSDMPPQLNAEEVADFRYVTTSELEQEMQAHPERFTVWFKLCFLQVQNRLRELERLR
jgi:isopentenyl-diphosphate Delta-isomerase